MLKLFRRKKDDKEMIVDQEGNEVEIEDEKVEEQPAPQMESKVEEPNAEETPKVEEPTNENPSVEVNDQVEQQPVATPEAQAVQIEEVAALKAEIETLKAELEAMKNRQVVDDANSNVMTLDAHFPNDDGKKMPRF